MIDAYQQIIDRLSRCRRVLITTHVRPDGDALGSVAAMVLALRRKQIDSRVLLLSHLPTKYAFIFRDSGIAHDDLERGDWPADLRIDDLDAILVVDTGTWSQLPGLKEKFLATAVPKIVLDHHLTQENWADLKLVLPEAAAAGEIVAELLEQWEIELDREIASALYLAIASDTGWFQFSNTRPFTLRLAATLMEARVDTDKMYQALYQNERPERLALQTRAQQSLQLLAGGKLAVMTITREDFRISQAGVPDTENLVNIPLQVGDVQVSLLITEPLDNGPVRMSLRSKGQVDVARFAENFGGGGHARAAGLKLQMSLAEASQQVVSAMERELA